jgi:type I restriction enzyme R subunit
VDKNLRYHGLIQAFSRTNRIYPTKTFGNIVTFRNLEQATIDAITVFGDSNTKNVVLEKSYQEYLDGFTEVATGKARRGYLEVVQELNERFPEPDEIVRESDKKAFVKLFGEYLRVENALQNFDEFTHLKALQKIDVDDPEAIEKFKETYFVTDEQIAVMQTTETLPERTIQDYRSTYNDIRDWLRRERQGEEVEESTIDWDDVVFEVDLLKSQEINLDYIFELILEHTKKTKDKAALIDEVRRILRASIENRAKETLIVDFINETDLEIIPNKESIIESFFIYAQKRQQKEVSELIVEENLKEEAAKRYIRTSLRRKHASENGTELNALLPKMSPLNPKYLGLKQRVFQKIAALVEQFKGIGGEV